MLLQETRVIRSISGKEPFNELIRLLTSVLGIGITTAYEGFRKRMIVGKAIVKIARKL